MKDKMKKSKPQMRRDRKANNPSIKDKKKAIIATIADKNVKSKDQVKRERRRARKGKKTGALKSEQILNELLADSLASSNDGNSKDSLQGFKVIKWKLGPDGEAIHHMFVKKHTVPVTELSKEKPPGKTLLCCNIPPYLTEVHLRQLFQEFGQVWKIFIHQNPTSSLPEKFDTQFPAEKNLIKGYKVAYVVFSDSKFVNGIMEISPDDVDPVTLTDAPACGLQEWMRQYNDNILSSSELEHNVRSFMENFDKDEVRRKEMEKNSGQPDEEGWVTVTRTGKRASGGAIRSETMEERLREKKRRQEKQLVNFTPAQMKESKMKQLMELKKKFEEDKQRVALLKQERKFKPF